MPRVVLFVGPNGSGKSTLKKVVDRRTTQLPERYIDPDEIEQSLTDLPESERREAAWKEGRRLRQEYRESRIDFVLETVFSHPSNLKYISDLRGDGYTIEIRIVITGDPEINIARVEARRQAGGHGIEFNEVRRLYERFLHLLPRIVEEADALFVFDTTSANSSLVILKQEGRRMRAVNPPDYLKEVLIRPLEARERERQETDLRYCDPGILPANESHGTYNGVLKSVGEFFVQETDTGFIRHDRTLFPNITLKIGDRVTFLYSPEATINNRGWPTATFC